MPPVVRRQPLFERIRIFLNPLDFLLWLSEELDTSGWEQLEKEWAISIGVGLNVVFLIARANANLGARRSDDVFGEPVAGNCWLGWLVSCNLHSMPNSMRLTHPQTLGFLFRTLARTPLDSQRDLHLLAQEALSALRDFC